MRLRVALSAIMLFACSVSGNAHEAGQPHSGPADQYVYALPAPGSYELPGIKLAADGGVLDEKGRPRRLDELTRDKITVMAFVYTQCSDLCALATLRMSELQQLAAKQPDLSRAVRLVTMSFDPLRDTPLRMAEQAELWRDETGPEWQFVTAPDEAGLAPVLKAYDQAVVPITGAEGARSSLSHVLRVFLIDPNGVIRNIYSADFLDPRLVLNDIITVRLSGPVKARSSPKSP
jgi:protein SCO1